MRPVGRVTDPLLAGEHAGDGLPSQPRDTNGLRPRDVAWFALANDLLTQVL